MREADNSPRASTSDSGRAADAGSAPAVSVVVPCYNGGRFIDLVLASLARQTFRDFEIIIVDDGSTDPATQKIFSSLDPAIRVIHQANRGLSAARNTGIRAARADLVLPLDCDDLIEPPFLAEAVALMRDAAPNVAVVFCHMRLTGAASGIAVRNFNRFDLLFTNTLPSGLLLRKTSWQAVGGYDESMRDGYEDWEFHLRLARAGYDGIEIAKPYYVYNIARDGMLLNRSTRVHGQLWRVIRSKHAALYRPWSILRLWWTNRDGTGSLSLGIAFAAYVLALLLPDSWYSRLVAKRRSRRLVEERLPPGDKAVEKSKFAA